MLELFVRRLGTTLVTMFLLSIVAFVIIQLPPGDFVDAYAGKKTQEKTAPRHLPQTISVQET